jgi:hypothetical protein
MVRVTPVLLSLLTSSLIAHDMYLLPAKFKAVKASKLSVAFHNGDSFPESEVAPKVVRLLDAKVTGQGGRAPVTGLKEVGKRTLGEVVIPAQGTLWLSVRTAPNFIELEPKKFEDYLKEEGLDEIIAWRKQHGETAKPGRERYSKYAKSLLQAGDPDQYFSHTLGLAIEIVPLADPSALKAGSVLPVRILLRGKPAAGLQLETAWADGPEHKTTAVGKTDVEGRIDVPILRQGLWRLHSLKMERCTEAKAADWESFWASLTFEVR